MAQQSGRPPAKYRQIAADLRARIAAGEYPVDERLPAEPELKATYKASGGTIVKALGELRTLGLVETRHGAGSFVLRQQPGESETQQLGEQVAGLRTRIADLERRAKETRDLHDKVSDLEATVIELLGKNGLTYQDRASSSGPKTLDRKVRHG